MGSGDIREKNELLGISGDKSPASRLHIDEIRLLRHGGGNGFHWRRRGIWNRGSISRHNAGMRGSSRSLIGGQIDNRLSTRNRLAGHVDDLDRVAALLDHLARRERHQKRDGLPVRLTRLNHVLGAVR